MNAQFWDHGKSVDQFQAAMLEQEDEWMIACKTFIKEKMVMLSQGNGRLQIFFKDPHAIRAVAKGLMDVADKWEAGELFQLPGN